MVSTTGDQMTERNTQQDGSASLAELTANEKLPRSSMETLKADCDRYKEECDRYKEECDRYKEERDKYLCELEKQSVLAEAARENTEQVKLKSKNDIAAFEIEIQQLKGEIVDLRTENQQSKGEIVDLRTENQQLKREAEQRQKGSLGEPGLTRQAICSQLVKEKAVNAQKLSQQEEILRKLQVERDEAKSSNDDLRSQLKQEKSLADEREVKIVAVEAQLQTVRSESEALADKVITERNTANKERDNAIIKQDNAIIERKNAIVQLDNVIIERDNAIIERDNAITERNTANREQNNAIIKQDNAIIKQKNTIVQLDNVIVERDNAIKERDEFQKLLAKEVERHKATQHLQQNQKATIQKLRNEAQQTNGNRSNKIPGRLQDNTHAELALTRQTLATVQRELKQSQDELYNSMMTRSRDTEAILSLRQEVTQLTGELQSKENQLELAETENQFLRQTTVQRELEQSQEKLDKSMTTSAHYTETILSLRQEVTQLTGELQSKENQLELAETENQFLRQTATQLQESANRLQAQLPVRNTPAEDMSDTEVKEKFLELKRERTKRGLVPKKKVSNEVVMQPIDHINGMPQEMYWELTQRRINMVRDQFMEELGGKTDAINEKLKSPLDEAGFILDAKFPMQIRIRNHPKPHLRGLFVASKPEINEAAGTSQMDFVWLNDAGVWWLSVEQEEEL